MLTVSLLYRVGCAALHLIRYIKVSLESFPATSDQSIDTNLDLNALVKHPPATFFFRVSGDSMGADCIHAGDLLIVDRSLEAVSRKFVVAAVDGELVVRRLHKAEDGLKLQQPGTTADQAGDFEVWGVITTVIHTV